MATVKCSIKLYQVTMNLRTACVLSRRKPCHISSNLYITKRFAQNQSLVSTSLPDVDSEIEQVSIHSLRGKAMRAMQNRLQRKQPMAPSREKKMKEDQEWSNVYPSAGTFKWSAVPLSVRMGYPIKRGIPPHKYGNAELLKIPNFLHLTPPAIKKHCAALKEFCTAWPEGLNTDEQCQRHFPLSVETADYVFSGPTIRHPKARVVEIKLNLSSLPLDKHARWKFTQLVGDRYDKSTNEISITVDRCPVKQQNQDYAMYLLSVLFHEAHIIEPWEETEITEEDMEEYVWEKGQSKHNVLNNVKHRMQTKDNRTVELSVDEEDAILSREDVQDYKEAYTDLVNNQETLESIEHYKTSALKLLGLKS